MALVFKFGENHEMPPVPNNFPQCGNYVPESHLHHNSELHLPEWLTNFFGVSNSSRAIKPNYLIYFVTIINIIYLFKQLIHNIVS